MYFETLICTFPPWKGPVESFSILSKVHWACCAKQGLFILTFCEMNVWWIGLAGAFVTFGCQIPEGTRNNAQKGHKGHQNLARNHFLGTEIFHTKVSLMNYYPKWAEKSITIFPFLLCNDLSSLIEILRAIAVSFKSTHLTTIGCFKRYFSKA